MPYACAAYAASDSCTIYVYSIEFHGSSRVGSRISECEAAKPR
jgi:hypothetical protein